MVANTPSESGRQPLPGTLSYETGNLGSDREELSRPFAHFFRESVAVIHRLRGATLKSVPLWESLRPGATRGAAL